MMLQAVRRLIGKEAGTRIVDAAFMKFAVVGLITTVMDMVLFSLLVVGAGHHPVAANLISYSCGFITSFVLNRYWTFGTIRSSAGIERQALRFLVSHAIGLALSSALVALFVLIIPEIAAKAISVPLVFIWNYALSRLWVFR